MEHWDAISEFITHTPSGHTSADGSTEIKDMEKPETNNLLARNLIRDFLIARIKKN